MNFSPCFSQKGKSSVPDQDSVSSEDPDPDPGGQNGPLK